MASERPYEVLERLGVRATSIRPLRKKAHNRHWLVRTGTQRLILRRYGSGRTKGDADYELLLLERLDRAGWPVPVAQTPLVEVGNFVWCVFKYLPGRSPCPRSPDGIRTEQGARGRMLARLHVDLAGFVNLGQREGWVRSEEVLGDRSDGPSWNDLAKRLATTRADEARILQWHADRVVQSLSELRADTLPAIIIHGDFAPWNLRFVRGKLSGIFDFDLSHLNLRVADFALSWRGRHDDVVYGYMEVDPLSEVELELITPVWWAWCLAGARSQLIREADSNLDWVMTHILRRSPLMSRTLRALPQT